MKNRLFILLTALFIVVSTFAQEPTGDKAALQKQMYALFSGTEDVKFFEVTELLKKECQKDGDEQLFYKTWGNQAIYETHHSRRTHGLEIAKSMKAYAVEHDSKFGQYTSVHVMAAIYYYMRSYEEAKAHFEQSIELLHNNFPGQSAAAAYIELTKIERQKSNFRSAIEYAKKALKEPNIEPQHELRALSMICDAIVRTNGSTEEFNHYYDLRKQVLQHTAPDHMDVGVNVAHSVLNGNFELALEQARNGYEEEKNQQLAFIYHAMGDDTKAYQYMHRHMQVSDSLQTINQSDLVAEYIVQLSNERLENERLEFEEAMQQMRNRFLLGIGAAIVALLVYVIWRRTKTIHRVRKVNIELDHAHKAEQAARTEAEKALDVKNEFLNNISHELRTPLNPLTGFSDILATPGFELQDEERHEMSQHIKDSSKILTGLIDNMIELSFYESKSSLAQDDIMPPNVLAMHVVDAMKPQCKPNVELDFTTTIPDNHKLKTNMQGVETVLHQLIDNAIKFTDSGKITVHCEERNGQAVFSITDTGCGIEPERQDKVFELFAETGENVKTIGMGLSICQAILKLLNGRIYLDKEYQQGCRFVFELPLNG